MSASHSTDEQISSEWNKIAHLSDTLIMRALRSLRPLGHEDSKPSEQSCSLTVQSLCTAQHASIKLADDDEDDRSDMNEA